MDKLLLKPCPVLHPTPQEFDSPIEYLSRKDILDLGSRYGLVKIVPPNGWKPPFSMAPSFTFHTRTQKLSDLGITSRSRKFFINNLNRFYKMSGHRALKSWFPCDNAKIYYYDLYLAVTKQFHGETNLDHISSDDIYKLNLLFGANLASSVLIDEYNANLKAYAEFLSSNGENFDFPESDPEDDLGACLLCRKNNSPTLTLLCDNCNNPFHMRCLQPPLEEVPEGSWYCDRCLIGTGAYGFEETPEIKYNIWDFVEHCKEFERNFLATYSVEGKPVTLEQIEKIFWTLVEAENSQLKVKYGADIHNLRPGEITGFPTVEVPQSSYEPGADASPYINHAWNLTRLPFAKGSLLNFIDSSISGMTVPWIYVGSLLSTFCWHVEDHYTLSANYCHFGNIKKWYGIPSSHADAFESLMKASAPDLFQRQPDLLHQLVTLISPTKLIEKGIPVVYADQGPNEFIVTYPRVYHAGFNSGFNFNEAVNFTMNSWLTFGERSVRDYKEIKKENVFDHFRLVENIMAAFVRADDQLKNGHELVGQCIRTYEQFLDNQMKLVLGLDSERIEKTFVKETAPTRLPITPGRETRMSSMKKMKAAGHDEEENLCDICRTYVSYQYCEINNQHHRFGRWYSGRPKRKDKILTVNRLLTPSASPRTEIKSEGPAEEVAQSDSAGLLEKLQERRPESDEFDELIVQARKRARGTEETKSKPSKQRRHSSRLQKSSNLPEVAEVEVKEAKQAPVKKVQWNSLLRHLNQFDSVKLCLRCTTQMCGERGEKAPRGSRIIFEKSFGDMQKVLEEAKAKYVEISQPGLH